MIPIIGYTDRWSARPGEQVAVMVSCSAPNPYRADFVEILSADPNPNGPGVRYREVRSDFQGTYPSRIQRAQCGSYGIVDFARSATLDPESTFSLRVQPWLLTDAEQVIACLIGDSILEMTISKRATSLNLNSMSVIELPPMKKGKWYELRLLLMRGSITFRQVPIQKLEAAAESASSGRIDAEFCIRRILFGARCEPSSAVYGGFFNGRIEDPALIAGLVARSEPLDLELEATSTVLCWWDFSVDISSDRFNDRGLLAAHGSFVNLPTRGVCGSRWSGRHMNWVHAPRDYSAVHFHEEDLYDCGWQVDIVATIPAGQASGIYGIRLTSEGLEDVIPIFVLPPVGTALSKMALLIPTFTYQIYANFDRGNCDAAYRERRAQWGAYPYHPAEYPEFGRSTYDRHADGSGVVHSSIRRPMLTCRPGFITYVDAKGSGLRHFAADMHLADWMHAHGLDFDVLTDHDLDREGAGLLSGYRCLLTGTHPEYHTRRSLDGVQEYVNDGGKLCYLGGNGFYWKIGNSAEIPDVVEIRRAEGGSRSWAADPGEYYHALDGEYGGLWRRNRRPPQQLTGVGFSAQGLFEGSYYRRRPESYDSSLSWMFQGISGDIIGDFGLSGGGAAGFELDRADQALGTPSQAVVVARSEKHQAHFGVTPEEILSNIPSLGGGVSSELIRADMTYFENSAFGAVFAVGSITFCGSLYPGAYENEVSALLQNVIRRFLED